MMIHQYIICGILCWSCLDDSAHPHCKTYKSRLMLIKLQLTSDFLEIHLDILLSEMNI